jgi:histidyl-tRNA synthetase
LQKLNVENPVFQQGLLELTQTVDMLKALGVPEKRTRLNLAIARGLDYYTGTVYETLLDAHPEFGSVCSGGRYDDLASFYTKSKLPGVGISIGLTRLFDQLNANKLLPPVPSCIQVLVTQLDRQLGETYLALATELRNAGFNVENYLEPAKLEKQLKYADKAGIPLAILIGTNEQAKGTVLVKNLAIKSQIEVPRAALVEALRSSLSLK